MQVPGSRAAENIIPRLQERHFIHNVPSSGKKINTTEDVWYPSNMDGGKTQGFAVYSVMSGCV
jgi:hypothetical protein